MSRRAGLAAVTLAALVLLVFGQTARHGFILFDDDTYITDNPVVGMGLTAGGAVWAFGVHARNWHPLTWLSHMLDVQLFQLRAGGHHLVSVLLHAANAVLLCGLLRALTGSLWRSLVVAAIFAVHPLRVESVAWAAERKDVLGGLFWLLTSGAYVRYARRRGAARYLAVLLLFALGLMAKPMLVTLPLVLLLLDWWPLGRAGGGEPPRAWLRLLLEKGPLLALAAASSAVTWYAQTAGLRDSLELSLPERLANALVSYTTYLWQLFWPARLAVLYPYPKGGQPAWVAAAAAVVLAAVSLVCVGSARRRPFLATGWFWYLVTLVPVIGFVQVGWQEHADRYTYLPQIGLLVALIWSAAGLFPAWRWRAAAGAAAAAVAVTALATAAFVQTAAWRSGEVLFRRALAVTRGNHRIMNNLGATLIDEGRYEEAVPLLRQSLAANPRHANAAYNLGYAWYQLGRYEEATASFDTALRLQPDDADTHYNAGLSLVRLARYAEAREHFRQVLRFRPGSRDARSMLDYARVMESRRDDSAAGGNP